MPPRCFTASKKPGGEAYPSRLCRHDEIFSRISRRSDIVRGERALYDKQHDADDRIDRGANEN